MDKEVRHLFIEIERKGTGYDATLSDDSIDRDGEFFSPKLIQKWAEEGGALPFLSDHVNSMQNLMGAWLNRRMVQENGNTMLKMEPKFFSEKANPAAQQLKQQIDEAAEMGLRVGLSIGFIPMDGEMVNNRYMHTMAELVEGSAVPVQSNRHASISLAKSFALKNNSFKKTSNVEKTGGHMVTLEELSKSLDEIKAENAKLKETVAELAGKKPELTAEQKAELDASKKEIAALKEKQEKQEKETAQKLEQYQKDYASLKEAVEKPKGKLPSSMRAPAGAQKDGETGAETFNATKAWIDQQAAKGRQ